MVNYQLLPPLSPDEYDSLKADISERGVLVPIEVDEEGNILDGHHRVQICLELGIESWPRLVRTGLSEEEKRQHARKLNLARRHLNQEQRRDLIDAQLTETSELADRQIAAGLGVSHHTVSSRRKELEAGGQIAHVSETRLDTLGRAQPARKPMKTVFVPDTDNEKGVLDSAKEIRAGRIELSRVARVGRISEISAGNSDLSTAQRYPVIYADPPWRYENPPMGDTNRSIENQYPTMALDEICALDVKVLATDDAILYMWATAPKLAECLEVVRAWDFEYRTCFAWIKDKIGMGYYARNQHELLLVCKRGNIPAPPASARVSSVVHAPRTEHSKKPDEFYEIIEASYPELPKIELFSRAKREGWAAWGNQAEVD